MPGLAELREATNENVRVARSRLLVFLVVGLILGILVAGVDDMALLTESHIVVPLMQVGVSIEMLFGLGPVLFLLLHLNLLVRLNRLYHVSLRLRASIEAAGGPDRRAAETALLHPFDFLQLLYYQMSREANISERVPSSVAVLRRWSVGWLARALEWIVRDQEKSGSVVFMTILVVVPVFLFPPCLLTATQMRFLPYQSELLTLVHQICVSADLVFQFVFVARLDRVRRFVSMIWKGRRLERVGYATYSLYALLFLVLCPVFVWATAIVPGSWLERHRPFPETMAVASSVMFGDWWEGNGCSLARYREPSFPRRYIHIENKTISAGRRDEEIVAAYLEKDEDPVKAWQFVEELDLGGRLFRYAWFDGSSFWRARFERSDLRCARFEESRLHEANLKRVDAHGVVFRLADLTGAQLEWGRFKGTSFFRARLDGANAAEAKFTGVDFREARLHGTDMSGSRTRATDFRRAELYGADLTQMEIHGSNANQAAFYGVDMSGAEVEATTFRKAKFHEVDTEGTEMALADLRGLRSGAPANWMQIRKAIGIGLGKRIGRPQATGRESRQEDTRVEKDGGLVGNGRAGQARCIWSDRSGRSTGSSTPGQSCKEELKQYRIEMACAKGRPEEAAGVAAALMPTESWLDVEASVALLATEGKQCAVLDETIRRELCIELIEWFKKQRFGDAGGKADPGREQYTGWATSWEKVRKSGVCDEL